MKFSDDRNTGVKMGTSRRIIRSDDPQTTWTRYFGATAALQTRLTLNTYVMRRHHILSALPLLCAPFSVVAQCELIVPEITFQADCSAGGTLRWTGQFMFGLQAIPSPCSGPFVYSLGNNGSYAYGTIADDWVQESPTSWRYNAPLTAGFSYVFIYPASAQTPPESPACDQWWPQCVASCMSGCYADARFTVPTSPGDCGVNFRLRAALDGALPSGTIMTDGLRAANLVPAAQPYTALGYTFVGSPTNVSITPAMLAVAGNDAIVDWVVVELRSNTTTVVYSKPALLQRDGDVIDTDGDTYMNFPVTAGSYYVALRHRNHLGVMTSTARSLTVDASSNLIDFRSSASGVYGTTPMALKGSVYCLWAGDATGTGTLSYIGANNDRDPILTAVGGTTPNNSLTNVYDRRDVNLDGVIRYTGTANDRDIILTNVGSTTPNNTRTQQLP